MAKTPQHPPAEDEVPLEFLAVDPVSGSPKPGKRALVLGGGAPNFTLMTGALLAFEEMGLRFDVVAGAGGGGAVALNYVAPKGMGRIESLKNSVNYGVADAIYRVLPMNYKVFQKGSAVAEGFRQLLYRMPFYDAIVNQSRMTPREKLLSDLIQAWWAAITPTTVNFFSKGTCAHAPFIRQMVDFDKLRVAEEEVYLNAYNVSTHTQTVFDKHQINEQHFGASLSYPFVYPPTDIDGNLFLEGAATGAFNFESLLEVEGEIGTIVVFDSFGFEGYIQAPPNLWQAWGQSLILPLIAITRADLQLFELAHQHWNATHPNRPVKLLVLRFDIPGGWAPTALDWSTSNLERLFQLGQVQGRAFAEAHWPDLSGKAR